MVRLIDGPAKTGSHCRDPAVVVVGDDNGSARSNDSDVVVVIIIFAAPVAVPFATDDELADLVIAADLATADEYAVIVVVVEVRPEERVRPAVVGPSTANVAANVESGPTEHRQRRWQRGRSLHWHICGSGDRRTEHRKRYARDQ
jgi:hypothetical protein